MRAMLRQFGRAPGRIVASIFALALAVGAIGVLAIPAVSEGTLHEAAERDGLADIIVETSPLDAEQIERIAAIDNVVAVDGEASIAVELDDGSRTRLVGLDPARTMDLVHVETGRNPTAGNEVVASPGLAAVGETLVIDGAELEVVGTGSTVWWSDSDVLFGDLGTVLSRAPESGTNQLVVTTADDSIDALRPTADQIRDVLTDAGDTFTDFPVYLPDGSTPIDEDIDQVSMLIGMLGVVAALVALVLLASTTNTLITERTREVAVMRALGGRSRPLRRRLRRIALGITAVALVIGLPLGIFISNFIARMVLEEFVGITPDFAIDPVVVVGSAVAMLIGARLVAARAARRVTRLPLAEALRDREGAPFGRRWSQRLIARMPTGGLFERLAVRASVRRPARTLGVVVQIAAAVGAAFLIPSLITSVNNFNSATYDSWAWDSATRSRGSGLPFAIDDVDDVAGTEAGVWVDAETFGFDMNVYGLDPDTDMFVPTLTDGEWFDGGREAVISAGFARHNSIDVGDTITVTLASGDSDYLVVGLTDDHSVGVYADRATVAADLGAPSMANVIWADATNADLSTDLVPFGATSTSTQADIAAEDEASRDAIVLIFGAIGVIVAGVAGLAVASSLMVSLFERRHELATLRALGARRRRLRGLLVRELLPIGIVGIAAGLLLGAIGTQAIIGSFESSNAIDIGVVLATGAIPFVVVGALLALGLLAAIVARSAGRRSIAVTLRGAA